MDWQIGPVAIGDYTYSSQNRSFIGLSSHPALGMDVVQMIINLDDCNACIRVVGDVSEIPYHGELLEFSLTTETVTGPFLARLQSLHGEVPWADRPSVSQAVVTMDDYDDVAKDLGLRVYAEAYGASNQQQHLAAMRCREAVGP